MNKKNSCPFLQKTSVKLFLKAYYYYFYLVNSTFPRLISQQIQFRKYLFVLLDTSIAHQMRPKWAKNLLFFLQKTSMKLFLKACYYYYRYLVVRSLDLCSVHVLTEKLYPSNLPAFFIVRNFYWWNLMFIYSE